MIKATLHYQKPGCQSLLFEQTLLSFICPHMSKRVCVCLCVCVCVCVCVYTHSVGGCSITLWCVCVLVCVYSECKGCCYNSVVRVCVCVCIPIVKGVGNTVFVCIENCVYR